jgi:hypothetical protein
VDATARSADPLVPERGRVVDVVQPGVVLGQAEVLRPQRRTQPTVQLAVGVDDRAGELGVVAPRAEVEVVGADGHPLVVDDADLGVDVDRRTRVILEVEHAEPVTARLPQQVVREPLAVVHRGTAEPALVLGVARHDRDHLQVGLAAQRVGERAGHDVGPEVLVLDVDQLAGAREGTGVGPGEGLCGCALEGYFRHS